MLVKEIRSKHLACFMRPDQQSRLSLAGDTPARRGGLAVYVLTQIDISPLLVAELEPRSVQK